MDSVSEESPVENLEHSISYLDHPYAVIGFYCSICQSTFTTRTSFILHQRKFHEVSAMTEDEKNIERSDTNTIESLSTCSSVTAADQIESVIEAIVPSSCSYNSLQCPECGSYLKSKKTLKKHMFLKHNVNPQTSKKSRFRCMACSMTLCRAEDLRKHYMDSHNLNLEVEARCFQTNEEFLLWKKEVEVESSSLFVKYSGDKHHREGKFIKQIFHCQRSGHFISHGVGQRRLKRNGSVKINGHCPARIYVTKWKEGLIEVHYTKTHLGHDYTVNMQSLEEHRVLEDAKAKLSKEVQNIIYQCQTIEELDEIRKSLQPAKSSITIMKRKRRRAELRNQFGSIPRNKKNLPSEASLL